MISRITLLKTLIRIPPSDEIVDIFAGLEDLSPEEPDEVASEDVPDINPVSSEPSQDHLANCNKSFPNELLYYNFNGLD